MNSALNTNETMNKLNNDFYNLLKGYYIKIFIFIIFIFIMIYISRKLGKRKENCKIIKKK